MRMPSSSSRRLDLAHLWPTGSSLDFPIDCRPVLLRRPFRFPSRWTPCLPKHSKGKVATRGSGFSLPVALAELSLRRRIPVWHGSVSCYQPIPLSSASEELPPLLDMAPLIRAPEGLEPS